MNEIGHKIRLETLEPESGSDQFPESELVNQNLNMPDTSASALREERLVVRVPDSFGRLVQESPSVAVITTKPGIRRWQQGAYQETIDLFHDVVDNPYQFLSLDEVTSR